VFGPPQPKERARRGSDGKWRTPTATRQYEAAVRAVATLSRPRRGSRLQWPLDARYEVTIVTYFANARRRDVDNVAKACLDALNGVAWRDDSQVMRLVVERGEVDKAQPRTVVTINLASEGS